MLSKSDKIKNAKLALEIIVLAYATIVLIIKIVFISMRNKPFITNNRDFLIDLGMTFLKNENKHLANYNCNNLSNFRNTVTFYI